MKKLDGFPYTSMGDGEYLYHLADQLTTKEKVLVARNNSSRLDLFETVFPDLLIWCSFSLEPHEWELDWHPGQVYKENWTFDLWLNESAHVQFQLAWGVFDEAA